MNAALSVIVSIVTVAAGGTAALAGDLLSPDSSHSVPADDCVAGVCLHGDGNETKDPGNETSGGGNSTAGNGTEPEQPPEEPGHHHHYHNETVHHHHEHNGTHGNRTAPPEEPEDVHFCTTGLSLLGEEYQFTWDVHDGYESFELDWHFQSLALGLVTEPDVYVILHDGAGNVVLEASGHEATSFHLDTDELRAYEPGTWSFFVSAGELAGEQGLVGHVEY